MGRGVGTREASSVAVVTQGNASLLVDSLVTSFESVSPTAGTNQTERGNLRGFSGIRHSASTKVVGAAGSYTMLWTTPSDVGGIAVAEFVRK